MQQFKPLRLMKYWFTLIRFKTKWLRPKNCNIKGKLSIAYGCEFYIDEQSSLNIETDLVLENNAAIFLVKSTINAKQLSIIGSKIQLFESALEVSGDAVVKQSNLTLKNQCSLKLGSSTTITNSSLFFSDKSTWYSGEYLLIEGTACKPAKISLIDKSNATWGSNIRLQCILTLNAGSLTAGSNNFINHGTEVRVWHKLTLGSYIFISYDVVLFDNNAHSTNPLYRQKEIELGFPNNTFQNEALRPAAAPVVIGNHVWVGMRAAILKGCVVGDNAIIGLATVVTGEVPPNFLATGNPFNVKPLSIDDKNLLS